MTEDRPRCGRCPGYIKQAKGPIINAKEQGVCFGGPPQCESVSTNGSPSGVLSMRPNVKPDDHVCHIYWLYQLIEQQLDKGA